MKPLRTNLTNRISRVFIPTYYIHYQWIDGLIHVLSFHTKRKYFVCATLNARLGRATNSVTGGHALLYVVVAAAALFPPRSSSGRCLRHCAYVILGTVMDM